MNKQTWLVAKNIYRNRIKGFGFWAMVISPFFTVAIYVVIGLFIGNGMSQTPKIGVVANPALVQTLKQESKAKADWQAVSSLSKAKAQLDAKKLDGYLVVEQNQYTLTKAHKTDANFDEAAFQSVFNQLQLAESSQRLGLSTTDVQQLLAPAKFTMKTQVTATETGDGKDHRGANIAIGTVASIFIFMLMMMYVGIIGQEIGNEKSSRIMETLLAATSSNTQYYGKIIGVILLAITQIWLYVIGFGAAYPFMKDQAQIKMMMKMISGLSLSFSLYLVAMSIVGILSYLILASIVASLVNEQSQVQQATQPVAFLSMIGYLGGIASSAVPGNLVLKVLSFIPFISPTLMTSRFAIQSATPMEAWLAFVLQLVSTIALAKASEKVYARNVLSYSDESIFKQLWRNTIHYQSKTK